MFAFTGTFNFQPFKYFRLPDCSAYDDAGQYDVDWDVFIQELPYLENDKKALFKGQKYFLLAMRYFFRVFYTQNIPSLRKIKKFMLENNLHNPLPTFWVK